MTETLPAAEQEAMVRRLRTAAVQSLSQADAAVALLDRFIAGLDEVDSLALRVATLQVRAPLDEADWYEDPFVADLRLASATVEVLGAAQEQIRAIRDAATAKRAALDHAYRKAAGAVAQWAVDGSDEGRSA